jgi:ribosome-binding protein aMBF1 (putative translation factor)
MAKCKKCGEDVAELKMVLVAGKKVKLCEDCEARALEESAVAEESEAVVQNMMGFTGRR